MGFSGRCEAMRAPTTENDTARVRPLRRARIGLAAASATPSAHSDQANHAAVRRLIPPTPRRCSLAPSVTTPLYNTTVCQALRQTLRAGVPREYPPVAAT